MTSIKPPSKPSVSGVDTVNTGATVGSNAPSGPAFRDRVSEATGTNKVGATGAAGGVANTQSIITELKSGAITPNEAVSRLTDAAMQRNRVPPAMRPAVESQVREFLQRDPVVAELVRTMGASFQSVEK
ncbi:MAG: hypothetical protein U0269_26995 [Polyangiales bacterium]